MIEFEKIQLSRARRKFHRLGIGQNETEWATEPGRIRIIDAINDFNFTDDTARLKFFKGRELDPLGFEFGIRLEVDFLTGVNLDRTTVMGSPCPVFNIFASVDD